MFGIPQNGHLAELNRPVKELFESFDTSTNGLTTLQAQERLARYGRNELSPKRIKSPLARFLSLFAEPLSLILIGAAIISAFVGDPQGALIITIMVVASSLLQFIQEHTSEQAAAKLARQVAITATVLRDGSPNEVPVSELVPGDIVQLGVGDIVPADCRVLSARDFFLHQAALTGESMPVEKIPFEGAREPASLPDMNHVVFFGTNVVSGTATALVVETNGRTEFGKLARSLSEERPETEFQRGINQFTQMLVRVIAILVVFIFSANLMLGRRLLDSLLFAVAVSVGITPELLPMIITINLSFGARHMAGHKVIVKRLQSIQNLGSMDILCTDKTGTLTEGKLAVHNHTDVQGNESERTLKLATINSLFQASIKNPMDAAIIAHCSCSEGTLDQFAKIDEIPFDFTRRRMSVIVATRAGDSVGDSGDGSGVRAIITKGAPESILEVCNRIEVRGEVMPMAPELRTQAFEEFRRLSAEGYRAVAVATRPIGNGRTVYTVSDESELIFVGFVSFIDPPKESAAQSVQELRNLGVDVKILTGDNELVTTRICERVGISVNAILMGHEVDSLNDDELARRAMESTICARLSPEQKNRVIKVLKEVGHVVGYMGDGINDAPSLRAADVGISVNNAVDVAKEAADIVLLEEGLHILRTGIIQGRRTFGNTLKYIEMGTSSNFGNMFSVPAALFLVPFLPMKPVQILLNNLLYDFAQVTIPTDWVDQEYIEKPKRWNIKYIRDFMVVFGPISSLYDILTYMVMLKVFHAGPELFQTGWFVESLATQTLVIHVIRSQHSIIRNRPSWALLFSTLAVVAAGFALPFSRLGRFFGFVPLPPLFFGVLVVMVLAYLAMVSAVKKWFHANYKS